MSWGLSGGLSAHATRKVRTVNLLNLVTVISLLLGSGNSLVMGADFAAVPIAVFMLVAIFSMVLSRWQRTGAAFLLFTLNVNLAIFFFCKVHPHETGTHLYYFPLVVSLVLLCNPASPDRDSLLHIALSAAFVIANLLVDIPSMRKTLSAEKIAYLWHFNLVCSICVTGVMSFLLSRVIVRQNQEIIRQNTYLKGANLLVADALKEKEVLLAELHHRVKNNLAIIMGLLNLQEDATTNVEAREVIGESRNRIMSMAMVHRMLFEKPQLKNIDAARYASELLRQLLGAANLRHVSVKESLEMVMLPVSKSIPLGLIMNEVMTNSIKYAFRGSHSFAQFQLTLSEAGGMVTVVMHDNGNGFPRNFESTRTGSLGISLIRSLAEQLDGKVLFSNSNGARVELSFPQ